MALQVTRSVPNFKQCCKCLSNIASVLFQFALAVSMPQLLAVNHINTRNGYKKWKFD